MDHLERLVHSFSRLPGIGSKSARRLTYYLLTCDRDYLRTLGELITSLPHSIVRCAVCGNYSEQEQCAICRDSRRDSRILCIVERPQDVIVLETAHEFYGYYHVLHGALAPLDGIGPADLNLGNLAARIQNASFEELIIATNPTVEGDATALYLKNLLADSGLRITRPALGLPMGGDLEYADRYTLARSLKGRIEL